VKERDPLWSFKSDAWRALGMAFQALRWIGIAAVMALTHSYQTHADGKSNSRAQHRESAGQFADRESGAKNSAAHRDADLGSP
jgi:hypothetical protein